MDDGLIPIGRFARLSGLSIGALRHYDELGLIAPAAVDPLTGYRRYRPAQLPAARTVARLRDLEVPIEEIRAVLAADDVAVQRRSLAVHADRLQARIDRLVHLVHLTRQLSEGREPLMPDAPTGTVTAGLDTEAHRQLGKDLYNHVWTLIEKSDRSDAEAAEMIDAAHASAWHWSRGGGTLAHAARAQWQLARVYATLRRAEPAAWHASRSLELAERAADAGVADDWDVPAALEALARAQAVAGDRAAALATRDRARQALSAIQDPEDRRLIEQDLETTPL